MTTASTSMQERLLGMGQYTWAPWVLYRALLVFTAVKLVWSWSALKTVLTYELLPQGWLWRGVFIPTVLGQEHPVIFLGLSVAFVLVVLFLRMRVITAFIFFWLCLNLYIINRPFDNGVDLLLLMLSFWTLLMAACQGGTSGKSTRAVLGALVVRLCQVQLVMLYFVSGWDKLVSPTWRNGDALASVTQLDYIIHPALYGSLLPGSWLSMALSWCVIAFELTFGFLVWHRLSRRVVVITGIVFHLLISYVLSLPDLSWLLMFSYSIFLTDRDYDASTYGDSRH